MYVYTCKLSLCHRFYLLRRSWWNKRIGLFLIDDEKYETDVRKFVDVGFTYRNYYHRDRISSVHNLFFFPLGWRTTDGTNKVV